MNLQPEFIRLNGALSNLSASPRGAKNDLMKIQAEVERLKNIETLADELAELSQELIDDLIDGSRYQHDMERKFNQIMKVRKDPK